MNRRQEIVSRIFQPRIGVRILVGISLLLMIYGHCIILGKTFDRLTGETYDLYTRWVSDYAAKHPEGWWIKASILTFCSALVVFFRRLAQRVTTDMGGIWKGFAVLVMSSMMIGGLILVAVFDLSPKQYEIIESQVILEQARTTEESKEAEPAWWNSLLDPKRATLREELLREAPLPPEELEPLQERIRNDAWDQEKVLDYLRAKLKEQEELEAAREEATVETLRELKAVPRGKKEWSKHWYHRLGFQVFLLGFVLSSLWIAWMEWREQSYRRLPGTLLQISLTMAFGIWLMIEKLGLAGIPQRALLTLIGYWLLRNLYHLRPVRVQSDE